MIALAASSLISVGLFIVLGCFVTKTARIPAGFTEKVLIGLVVANTITSILSIFYPINIYILATVSMICIFLCYFIRNDLMLLYSFLKTQKKVIFYAIPFILIGFFISLGEPRNYDTSLYHIQAIKWIEEYAVVPGLANLHGRFGFNPNIFTFYAFTSLFDIFDQEVFSVNFTIYAILVLHFIDKIYCEFKQHGVTNLLIFNVVVFATIISLSGNLSTPSPDYISTVLPLFILASFVKPLNQKNSDLFQRYIAILILCIYVLTVKLSTIPLLLLAVFVVIKNVQQRWKIFLVFILCTVVIIPWLVRNIILTGWLLYPFPSIDLFDFDWKVPVTSVIREKLLVTGFARSHDKLCLAAAQLSLSDWFPGWWGRLHTETKLLIMASASFPVITFVGILTKKIKVDYYVFAVIFTSFIGIIFWFILAPDLRFGKAFLIIAAISPLLYFKFNLTDLCKPYFKLIPILYAIIIVLYCINAKNITRFDIKQTIYANTHFLIKPQPIRIPANVDFQAFSISGVNIYVPTTGDCCFHSNLPCAPFADNTLMLRNKTLQSGFKHL